MKVKISDIWFSENLIGLIKGELALIKKGKKKKIDRNMLENWISENK